MPEFPLGPWQILTAAFHNQPTSCRRCCFPYLEFVGLVSWVR